MPNHTYSQFTLSRSTRQMVDGRGALIDPALMKGKFTAIIAEAPEGGYWAICPEVPGANGQGATVTAAKKNLRAAIRLISADRLQAVSRPAAHVADAWADEAVARSKAYRDGSLKSVPLAKAFGF
jgi:predicted RNase H-like HicB family nuclease